MKRLNMSEELFENIYKAKQFDIHRIENPITIGRITEKDKFLAAKQILLGLAILYLCTVLAYLFRPVEGSKLIDICTTTFPPLATLILMSYFQNKAH